MIVVKLSNGDEAEAETMAAALLAADTLTREAVEHGAARRKLRVTLLRDGVCVLADVTLADLRALVTAAQRA